MSRPPKIERLDVAPIMVWRSGVRVGERDVHGHGLADRDGPALHALVVAPERREEVEGVLTGRNSERVRAQRVRVRAGEEATAVGDIERRSLERRSAL